jgi:hypothetical protein
MSGEKKRESWIGAKSFVLPRANDLSYQTVVLYELLQVVSIQETLNQSLLTITSKVRK